MTEQELNNIVQKLTETLKSMNSGFSNEQRKEIAEIAQMTQTGLNARLESKIDMLVFSSEKQEQHLAKMNGRISKTESSIISSDQERKVQDQKNNDEFKALKVAITEERPHNFTCLNEQRIANSENDMKEVKADVKEIKKSLLEYNFLTKYPKTIVMVLAMLVVIFIFTTANLYENYTMKKEKQKTEQVEKTKNANEIPK